MDVTTALQLLDHESSALDTLVAGLTAEQWRLPTPAEGWSIADQIAHLMWTDQVSVMSILEPAEFTALAASIAKEGDMSIVDREAHRLAATPPAQLLEDWRTARSALADALAGVSPDAQLTWFGPPMRPVTMVTARIMETWAHALDVYDALGVEKPAAAPLAAVARIGVRTRDFAFKSRRIEAPTEEFRVELTMPDGELLEFGPVDAAQQVTGSAWAFAAVVTQRRNIADVDLHTEGDDAARWMSIAQAFAGAPTQGPTPGERGQR
ncbi:MAG: TIGR03084 family protein [Leucobacter sp.]|jgi:uncharacterized protein (TIGR03084 family)|nr:TIGR03084 family protein [Leucobacter sp.]